MYFYSYTTVISKNIIYGLFDYKNRNFIVYIN